MHLLRSLALALLVLLSAMTRPVAADEMQRFALLFRSLAPCQLFHLTELGFMRVAPTRFYIDGWSQGTVSALRDMARTRRMFRISLRSTVFLQVAGGSSLQASTAFDALLDFMREHRIEHLDRTAFMQASMSGYRAALERGGYHACFVMKWGNRRPDFFAQPLKASTWTAVRAVFAPGGADPDRPQLDQFRARQPATLDRRAFALGQREAIGDDRPDAALSAGMITHDDEDGLLSALHTHLAPFMPADHAPRADGRPRLCAGSWCREQPVDAW